MSTRQDVLNARQAFEDHVARHKCRTGEGCPERIRLWVRYVGSPDSVAARWNEQADRSRNRP